VTLLVCDRGFFLLFFDKTFYLAKNINIPKLSVIIFISRAIVTCKFYQA